MSKEEFNALWSRACKGDHITQDEAIALLKDAMWMRIALDFYAKSDHWNRPRDRAFSKAEMDTGLRARIGLNQYEERPLQKLIVDQRARYDRWFNAVASRNVGAKEAIQ